MTTHGIREDFKEEEPGKEKERKKRERKRTTRSKILQIEEQRKGKRKRKEQPCRRWAHWAQDGWQGTGTESWNHGYWADEDETAWQSRGWGEWQEDYYDANGYYPGRGRKEREDKERNAMDLNKIQQKHKVMGKEKQTT